MSNSEVENLLQRIDDAEQERDRAVSEHENLQVAVSEALTKLRNGREQDAIRMLEMFA
jgi:hypothetical protein